MRALHNRVNRYELKERLMKLMKEPFKTNNHYFFTVIINTNAFKAYENRFSKTCI